MERLSFDETQSYSAVEGAIHLARYSVAAPYCRDARVLDIACGEGYGAHFLASLGAAEVIGVEVDAQTVNRASARFGSSRVRFKQADANCLSAIFQPNSFDLIVSLETIEHLSQPKEFLKALRSVGTSTSTFVLSCPNDHWYFPGPEEGNPFHLRKYTFAEFRHLAESILGTSCRWLIGAPVMGFGAVPIVTTILNSKEQSQSRMLDYARLDSAFAVPAPSGLELGVETSSFFVGIWGDNSQQAGAAVVYPISMNGFSGHFFPVAPDEANNRAAGLEQRVRELEERIALMQKERRAIRDGLARLYRKITKIFQPDGL
jgi:2-polyprenyl-3-methyl-5-hydroxy-6-metoxy-1,4-benzoquinol methylase